MSSTGIERRVVRLVILTAAAFAASGANPTANSGTEEKREWGAAVENQAISIATPKAAYEPGERIVLSIRIWNVGTTGVPVRYPAPFEYDLAVSRVENPRIWIRDRQGQPILPAAGVIPRTLYGRLKWETPQSSTGPSGEIKPGEQRCVEVDLTRLFDMSLDGKYKVSAQRRVWGSRAVELPSTATSNTLEISVNDKPFYKRGGCPRRVADQE